ncbi:MAG TPA: hypothetical protein VIG06_13060, partial [Kofleriaceae bacterium]
PAQSSTAAVPAIAVDAAPETPSAGDAAPARRPAPPPPRKRARRRPPAAAAQPADDPDYLLEPRRR